MLCPIFGGVPATAALARTATNIRAGAQSPISSVVHSVFVLACTLSLAPIVGYLPMAAMAGLLLVIAYNMSDLPHFSRLVRTAPRSAVFVLFTCFILTIAFDMVVAVAVGVVLGAMIFMSRMAELTSLELDPTLPQELNLPEDVVLYRIAGPLFFGAAERAFRSFSPPASAKAIVLEMSAVPEIDATALVALESVLSVLRKSSRKVVFSGLAARPTETLARAGIVAESSRIAFAPTLDDALSLATLHVARTTPAPQEQG
jgi:SulP family sulfate permease